MYNSSYQRYTVGTDALALDLGGCKKLLLRVDSADVEVARDSVDFDNNSYFVLSSGSTVVFDADPITGIVPISDLVYFRCDTSATLSVWRMG